MVYPQPRIRPRKWGCTKFFEILRYKRSPNLSQTTRPSKCQQQQQQQKRKKKEKKKRAYQIVDFVVPADHRVKLKQCEKRDKYLDLARELKKRWNMNVTEIPVVIGALSTVTKGLVQGLDDLEIKRRVETIQTAALLRSTRILRRVLETWGDLQSFRFQRKTTS